MALQSEVQQFVYSATVEAGRPPRSAEVAEALEASREEILAAFAGLRRRRLLALAPESGEILMAPPFSAVPTAFLVRARGCSYFGNCVWDAYGIAAALAADAEIDTSCACCGEPIALRVEDATPVPERAVAHFAVPAAHWWDDIFYT
ncbi:MAG: organomercurial lyase [Thermoanaerobaculia bacterium]